MRKSKFIGMAVSLIVGCLFASVVGLLDEAIYISVPFVLGWVAGALS